MPKDKDGNIADVIVCGSSRFSRMIPGSLYELFLSGAQRDIVRHHLKPILGWKEGMSEDKFIYSVPDTAIMAAWQEYLEFLYLTTHTQYNSEKTADMERIKQTLYDICKDGVIYLYMPIGDPIDLSKSIPLIKKRFNITMGYVSMVDEHTGETIHINDPSIQIGAMYMMLLDKIGDEWMAASTANMHLFGISSPVNKSARHNKPWRLTPPKFLGETEGRLITANCGPMFVAEQQSRANSVQTQKSAVWNLLNSDNPTQIVELVDRSKIPYSDVKPLQTVRHMVGCVGVDLKWEPSEKFVDIQKDDNAST